MRRTLAIVILLVACFVLQAQPGQGRERRAKEPPKIEEMVSDLSAIQKKRLTTVMENSRKEVDKLQAELDNVRNQIRSLMEKDGDNSDQLFPLFDRESVLRAEISKEMYRTRQQIDKILTKEQLAEFRKCCKADHKKHKKGGPALAPKKDGGSGTPADKPRRAKRS